METFSFWDFAFYEGSRTSTGSVAGGDESENVSESGGGVCPSSFPFPFLEILVFPLS